MRQFMHRHRAIVPHAEELAGTLAHSMFQAIQSALTAQFLGILNHMESMKDRHGGEWNGTIETVITELAALGEGQEVPGNGQERDGDGTDPEE